MYNYAYIYNNYIHTYTHVIYVYCIYIYICRMLYIHIYIYMYIQYIHKHGCNESGISGLCGPWIWRRERGWGWFTLQECLHRIQMLLQESVAQGWVSHGESLLRGISLGKTHRCMRQNAIAWQENDWNMLDVPGFSTPQIPWFLIFFPSNCYRSWVSPCSDPPALSSVPNVNLAVSTGEKNRTRQGSSWRRWRWTCWRRAVEIAAIFSEVTCWR